MASIKMDKILTIITVKTMKMMEEIMIFAKR